MLGISALFAIGACVWFLLLSTTPDIVMVSIPWMIIGLVYGVNASIFYGCYVIAANNPEQASIVYGFDATVCSIGNLIWSILIGGITNVDNKDLPNVLRDCVYVILGLSSSAFILICVTWRVQYTRGNILQKSPEKILSNIENDDVLKNVPNDNDDQI